MTSMPQTPVPMGSMPQTPPPAPTTPIPQTLPLTPTAPQLTGSPAGGEASHITPTSSTPTSPAPPPPMRSAQATAPSSVSAVKPPPQAPFLHTARSQQGRKRRIIAGLIVLLLLASLILVLLNTLLNPAPTTPQTVGTLIFTDSGQYDPATTVGFNDIVTLSLHNLTTPQTGMAYFVWFLPDQGDDTTPPLLLGRLAVNAGKATLQYASPAHTNLLAQYSGVRIIEQQALNDPSTPSPDPKTWHWEGWIPHTPTPGDAHQYSMLSHFRHLLAKDPTLQANHISGGLLIWMARNMEKVEEWSSAAQGSWADKNPDLIHRHMLRILDYLDGQAYVWHDVPAGSPWLVDPVAGKLGLLSYAQDQQPPGYLPHVDHHLQGLVASPGHTEAQKKVAIQVDKDLTRMINDLEQVRKDAIQLVRRSNEQLLQPDALTLLNEMTTLTREANSGWFDPTTHTNAGGAIWMNAQAQQMATISLTPSNAQ